MSGTKRGLLAPQNTFLENIIRKTLPTNANFIIANARIVDYPVVFCSEGFSKLSGYNRAEVMLKSAKCTFMFGDLTDKAVEKKLNTIFDLQLKDSLEVLLYKKSRTPMWVILYISPIYNEKEKVVLHLVTAKDITAAKIPVDQEDDSNKVGFGRFARLARSVTRGKNISSQASQNSIKVPEPLKIGTNTNVHEDLELPKYMLEAPKTPPYTILHTSTFKQTWDWVLFLLTVYTAIMVPFEIVYELAQEDIFVSIIDLCVDTAFIIDIVISFRTTYVDTGGEVVSDSKRIRNNYIKGWFGLDIISSVPLEMIDMVIEQINTSENEIFTQLRLIKLVRLLRLVRVIRRLDHYMEYAGGQLLMFLSIFLLFAHWFALVWYGIGVSEHDKSYGWITLLEDTYDTHGNYSFAKQKKNSTVVFRSYVSSLYFTMSSMTSIGFGNIAGNTNTEKIFCIVLMFIGSLLYATIFGNVTTMFQQMSSQSTRYHEMLNDIREFMKLYQVPKDLGERVMDYVVSTWAMTKGVNSDKVMNYCPKDMRADLSIHLNRHILREHPAFRLASEGCLRALAISFEMHHSAPGDLLFHTGESIEELCFIASGSLEVIQEDEIVAILGKGDVIGDKFWVEKSVGQSIVNVRALTYTDLHIISRDALQDVLMFYSSFANSFSRNLVLTFNLRQRVRFKKVSDLKKEQEMAQHNDVNVDLPPDHPVRKLFNRFRGKLSDDNLQKAEVNQNNNNNNYLHPNNANSVKIEETIEETTAEIPPEKYPTSPRGGGITGARRGLWSKFSRSHLGSSTKESSTEEPDEKPVRFSPKLLSPKTISSAELDDKSPSPTFKRKMLSKSDSTDSGIHQSRQKIEILDAMLGKDTELSSSATEAIRNLLQIRKDLNKEVESMQSKLQRLDNQIIEVVNLIKTPEKLQQSRSTSPIGVEGSRTQSSGLQSPKDNSPIITPVNNIVSNHVIKPTARRIENNHVGMRPDISFSKILNVSAASDANDDDVQSPPMSFFYNDIESPEKPVYSSPPPEF